VRARVLALDAKKRRVSLGMKAEHLQDAADEEDESNDDDDDAKLAKMSPDEQVFFFIIRNSEFQEFL
jgi:ribosomal protein S1